MISLWILLGGLALLLFQYIYRKSWDKGLSFQLRFEKDHAYCHEEATLVETLENRKKLPLPAVDAAFRIQKGVRFMNAENTTVSDYIYKRDVFSILGMESITRRYRLECMKRGRYTISQVVLSSHSLLYRRHYRREDASPELSLTDMNAPSEETVLYVYAGRRNVSRITQACEMLLGTQLSRRKIYEDPFAFASIREYTVQDPMKTINWKASAKTGSLMVNTFSSVMAQQFMIYLDIQDRSILKTEELIEEGICIAASLFRELTRGGQEVGLCVNASYDASGMTVFLPERKSSRLVTAERFLTGNFDRMTQCSFEKMIQEIKTGLLPIWISKDYSEEIAMKLNSMLSEDQTGIFVVPCKKNTPFGRKQTGKLTVIPWAA